VSGSPEMTQLRVDHAELIGMRAKLAAEKSALQSQLAQVNARLSTRQPSHLFQKIQNERADLIRRMSEKDGELSQVKSRLAEINAVISSGGDWSLPRHIIRQLVHIRDKWHAESMKEDNAPNVRRACFAFSQELKVTLQPYFDSEKTDTTP
jgi:predicted nuclease with TOPRIM domain